MGQACEGHSLQLRVRQPGVVEVLASSRRSYARHSHEQYGIGLIEHGAQRSASGRGPVEAGAGQVITVNPGEVHDGQPIGDGPRRWRMLYLDVDVVRGLHDDVHDGGGAFEFTAPVMADMHVGALVRGLFEGPLEAGLLRLIGVLGHRRRVLTGVGRITQARARIDDDPVATVSLQALAEVSGLSRFQTLRAFVKTTGLTPHAYQMQRRLDLAQRLIRAGTPLALAAADSGFSDQSHLNRVFVRAFGYTPGAWARAVA